MPPAPSRDASRSTAGAPDLALRGRVVVGAAVAMILAAFAVLLANEATHLSATLANTLLDQIGVAAGNGVLPGGHGSAPPSALQLLLVSPLSWGIAEIFFLLEPGVGAPYALATMRFLQIALYESGAVVLYALALRRGLRPRIAVGLALLFAAQPMALTTLWTDFGFPGATLLLWSELARARGSPGASSLLAAGTALCHPAAGIAPLCWNLLNAYGSRDPDEQRGRRQAVVVIGCAMILNWLGMAAAMGIWKEGSWIHWAGEGRGHLRQLVANGRLLEAGRHLFANVLEALALLGTAGFCALRRPALLLPIAFDLLYGIGSQGVGEHGLVLTTVGVLFAISVAVESERSLRSAGLVLCAAGALSLALWALDARGLLRSAVALRPPGPYLARLETLRSLETRRCVVTPTIAPFFHGRCAATVPYAYRDRIAPLDAAPTLVVIAPLRAQQRKLAWSSNGDVLEWDRSRPALRAIAEAVRRGELRLVTDSVDLLVFANDQGSPASAALLARLDELQR